MGDNWTVFRPSATGSGGGSGSSGTYVQDMFVDTSLPATNNGSLTSTASTNPLGALLVDNDAPKYSAKTLYVKNFTLIADRRLWLNNKPTYTINFTENCPYVVAYAVGNIRLRTQSQGTNVEVRDIGDVFGLTGRIRRVLFHVDGNINNPGTAEIFIDGVDTGNTVNYGNQNPANSNNGIPLYSPQISGNSNQTDDLHDYRLVAQQTAGLFITAVTVYFENATQQIEVGPGNTYVAKVKQTTAVSSLFTPPTPVGFLGNKNVLYKTPMAGYAIASNENAGLSSIATGNSGTNLLTVTTGTGQSFAIGEGLVVVSGTSYYVGSIQTISTDTFTVGPTLPFGLSGLVYKAWYAGSTLTISSSLYQLKSTLDIKELNNFVDKQGFGGLATGDFYYQDPNGEFRIWGQNLQITSQDGYPGVAFQSATFGFLQIDGRFDAMDFESIGYGVLNGTFSINGTPGWGLNQGQSGYIKRTVFTDSGPSWNSVVFGVGQSFANVVFTKFNLWCRDISTGFSGTPLASFETFINKVPRTAINATFTQLGSNQRIFSDQLFLTGAWTRGLTAGAAGGVRYYGTSTNSNIKVQYYGGDFSLIGADGSSSVLTIDGASHAVSFNKTIPLGVTFHSIVYTVQGGTAAIDAFDFAKPQVGQLKNKQVYLPRPELAMGVTVVISGDTPRDAPDGTFWVPQKENSSVALPSVWLRLFNFWHQIQIIQSSEDPNLNVFVRAYGTKTDNTFANGVTDVEHFNNISWIAGNPSPLGARSGAGTSDSGYAGLLYVVDGVNTSGSVTGANFAYNKITWSALNNRGTALMGSACAAFNGSLYVSCGSNDTANTGVSNGSSSWNTSAWATLHIFVLSRFKAGSFVINAILSVIGGIDSTGGAVVTHETKNSSDSLSTNTAVPAAGAPTGSCNAAASTGIAFDVNTAKSSVAYSFNGTTWALLTAAFQQSGTFGNGAAFSSVSSLAINNGGYDDGGGVALNNTQIYNGAAILLSVPSNTSRALGVAGVI